MPKKTEYITYETEPGVAEAFLYNCRKRDLYDGPGILRGTIIQGVHGVVAAEVGILKFSGREVQFAPNGRCNWQGHEMECHYLPGSPNGKSLKGMNYIVARVSTPEVAASLKAASVPVLVTPDGHRVVNLEIDRFKKQKVERRATLI